MGGVERPGELGLELVHVRAEHEFPGVAHPVDRVPDLAAERRVLAIEREERHGRKEVGGGTFRGGGLAGHGARCS